MFQTRVLLIPELLEVIIQYAQSDMDLALWARVSKTWQMPALQTLWYVVEDAAPLFALLGSVEVEDDELVGALGASHLMD